MKRLLVRVSLFVGVVLLGTLAIAQAQKALENYGRRPAANPSEGRLALPSKSGRERAAAQPVRLATDLEAHEASYDPPGLSSRAVQRTKLAASDEPAATHEAAAETAGTESEPDDSSQQYPEDTREFAPHDPSLADEDVPVDQQPVESVSPEEPTGAPHRSPPDPFGLRTSATEPIGETTRTVPIGETTRTVPIGESPSTLPIEDSAASDPAPADAEPAVGDDSAEPVAVEPGSADQLDEQPGGDSPPLSGTNESTHRAAEPRRLSRSVVNPGDALEPDAATVEVPPHDVPERPRGNAFEQAAPARATGRGRPGDPRLEGPQAPQVTIEKVAPREIQVGKPAVFTIKVRNSGSAPATAVEVFDELPQGTELVSSKPPARLGNQGELTWELGTLQPSDEAVLNVELLPQAEGEIGSTASVRFQAAATVRTTSTRPQLEIDVSAPEQVLIGEAVPLAIKVSNPGSGAATGVFLTATLPPGLRHEAGKELEMEIGQLKPGQTRSVDLQMTATAAGKIEHLITAEADANLAAEARTPIEVLAPALKVGLSGPKRRYLERNATYAISVTNPGTAPARDVELVTVLPKGLKFVSATNAGEYDAATHSVYWSLAELPPQEAGTVNLTTVAVEPGELRLRIRGQAESGLRDEQEETVLVEGLAAIQFELTDVQDPVEIGGQTTYEIRVVNQGSKAATNVRVSALIPAEMKPISAEGPARHVIDSQRVIFDPLPQLAPKADATYTLKVQAEQAGDLRLRVQIVTDEVRTPVTREESTHVYADE